LRTRELVALGGPASLLSKRNSKERQRKTPICLEADQLKENATFDDTTAAGIHPSCGDQPEVVINCSNDIALNIN
jgi:hypothetical protein